MQPVASYLIGAPPWQAGLSPSVIGYSRIVMLLNVTCFEIAVDEDEDEDKVEVEEVDVDEDRRDGIDNRDGCGSCFFSINPLFVPVLIFSSCVVMMLVLSVILLAILLAMISSPSPSLFSIDRFLSDSWDVDEALLLFVLERVLFFNDVSIFLMIVFGI